MQTVRRAISYWLFPAVLIGGTYAGVIAFAVVAFNVTTLAPVLSVGTIGLILVASVVYAAYQFAALVVETVQGR